MTPQPVRPTLRLLSEPLIERIVTEARDILGRLGTEVTDPEAANLLLGAGAGKDGKTGRILLGGRMIEAALNSAPGSFRLHDRAGEARADLGGNRVHFTPGSSAMNLLDGATREIRRPVTADYIRYARLVDRLTAIDYQSTAFIPSDVPERISDSYRLYLSLIYGAAPVVTGAFTSEGLRVMIDLLLAVRGGGKALADSPLALFSCCSTAPLRWSKEACRGIIECARYGIPVELIATPLTGFVAPATLTGTLVQHTAENLSGLVLSQTAAPGAPVLWGGSPAVFDYRYETTPMGGVETLMIECACSEIGKALGLPTQAYASLSDSKCLDAQAGMETASGAVLASLAGINSISGPGILDFVDCQSLEKLVLDNEICASAKRLIRGIEIRKGDFPALSHFRELLREGHLLVAGHTRRWIREEVRFPEQVIDRTNRARYIEEGSPTLEERARRQVDALLKTEPMLLEGDRRRKLDAVMTRAARAAGIDGLPAHEI